MFYSVKPSCVLVRKSLSSCWGCLSEFDVDEDRGGADLWNENSRFSE